MFLLWQRGMKNREQRRAHAPKPQETIPQSHPSATDAFSISGVLIPWSSSSTICSGAVQKSCLASVIQLLWRCVCVTCTQTGTLICVHVNKRKEREEHTPQKTQGWSDDGASGRGTVEFSCSPERELRGVRRLRREGAQRMLGERWSAERFGVRGQLA